MRELSTEALWSNKTVLSLGSEFFSSHPTQMLWRQICIMASTHMKWTWCSQCITKWAQAVSATLQKKWDHWSHKQQHWKWEEYTHNMHHQGNYSWEISSCSHLTKSLEKKLQMSLYWERHGNKLKVQKIPPRGKHQGSAVHLDCIPAEIKRELNHSLQTPRERFQRADGSLKGTKAIMRSHLCRTGN